MDIEGGTGGVRVGVAMSLGGGRLILLRVTLKLRRGPRALVVRLGMGGLVQGEGGRGWGVRGGPYVLLV